MAQTAGDILVETLIDWGVEVVFGIPGDGINGVFEALRTRQDKIRFIQVRHEETAAFAACAYAKWTGKLGVCIATSGPAESTFSTAFTTPSSTTSRCSPSPASSTTTFWRRSPSRTSRSTSSSWNSVPTASVSWAQSMSRT